MEYMISDVLGKIQKWYFESLLEKEDFESEIEENEDEEDVSYDEDAFTYIYDNIMDLCLSDYEEFLNIVSLLTLECFNIMMSEEIELIEEDIQLLNILKESSKDEFIDIVQNGEDDILFNMLSLVLEYYGFEDIDVFDFSSYSYNNMDKAYKNEVGKKLYKEFHPNLYGELNVLNKQKQQNQYKKTIEKLEITSLFSFIYNIVIFKQLLIDKNILYCKFLDKLIELRRKNNKLYIEILSYLIGYYYVVMDKKIIDDDEEELGEERQLLDNLRNDNLKDIFDCPQLGILISEFINYDFLEYDKLLNESSDKVKTMVKKLNENNNFEISKK